MLAPKPDAAKLSVFGVWGLEFLRWGGRFDLERASMTFLRARTGGGGEGGGGGGICGCEGGGGGAGGGGRGGDVVFCDAESDFWAYVSVMPEQNRHCTRVYTCTQACAPCTRVYTRVRVPNTGARIHSMRSNNANYARNAPNFLNVTGDP